MKNPFSCGCRIDEAIEIIKNNMPMCHETYRAIEAIRHTVYEDHEKYELIQETFKLLYYGKDDEAFKKVSQYVAMNGIACYTTQENEAMEKLCEIRHGNIEEKNNE